MNSSDISLILVQIQMRNGGNIWKILVGRPEGKRPLGRCRSGWENNIRMDLREIGL
jgi:hypothetical protein